MEIGVVAYFRCAHTKFGGEFDIFISSSCSGQGIKGGGVLKVEMGSLCEGQDSGIHTYIPTYVHTYMLCI